MGGLELTYELGGEQQGTMQVDERSGWTISAEITQHLRGKVTMTDASGQTSSWPIVIDSTITYETRD